MNDISSISEIYYADGSMIGAIESDLLRTSVASDAISDNFNRLSLQQDEHFAERNGVVPKAAIRASLELIGLGSSSGGSHFTQQLIKQQVVGDAPTLAKARNLWMPGFLELSS